MSLAPEFKLKRKKDKPSKQKSEAQMLKMVTQSFDKIPPAWPINDFIAVNPLQGFEAMDFEDALAEGQNYFQKETLPLGMEAVNRESIKWLQVFFDEGQASIAMPSRELGLLASIRKLLPYDQNVCCADKEKIAWLASLPQKPNTVILECLMFLGIGTEEHEAFLTLMLTTLPGWAAYVQYATSWGTSSHPVSKEEYLALRLVLTCLLWPNAKQLLSWHQNANSPSAHQFIVSRIKKLESQYINRLLLNIASHQNDESASPEAQLLFCIDTRSESFRHVLEQEGNYETFGVAGFFGIPTTVENHKGEKHAACPVLLKPKHHIKASSTHYASKKLEFLPKNQFFRKIYQSLKYTFAAPFALAEAIGAVTGLWMLIRTLFVKRAGLLRDFIYQRNITQHIDADLDGAISRKDQCNYAEQLLKGIGLTENFAEIVVLCGHGSTTENNAYASALNCGACGGNPGGINAIIMATILNKKEVRLDLQSRGIMIGDETLFVAAEHNTTTDVVTLFDEHCPQHFRDSLMKLKGALKQTAAKTSQLRLEGSYQTEDKNQAASHALHRSMHWAEVRPEWGLAKNAAFIIGPRQKMKGIDLQGRAFLHSYDWSKDPNGQWLKAILTAPMIVAQWINMQYLFSTLDNVAYGSGSKITANVTGKVGVMQGCASDLMHGLPLQSVYQTDDLPYHEPMRLHTVIMAPRYLIFQVILSNKKLKQLFGHGWVKVVCIEPNGSERFVLQRDLSWKKLN